MEQPEETRQQEKEKAEEEVELADTGRLQGYGGEGRQGRGRGPKEVI